MLIPLSDLVKKYSIKLSGVLHVGAHEGEENSAYISNGATQHSIYWVEANPSLCESLSKHLPNVIQAAVSDKVENVTFHVTNNYQSSSILELEEHRNEHPHIHVIETLELETKTLDSVVEANCIYANFLNMDIQGAELKCLQGFEKHINMIDYVYTEVNTKYLYKGCALLDELDEWLSVRGFDRKETSITQHGWGDALYIRRTIMFDIGANIGNWSLANVTSENQIIAVEASPSTFRRLVENCNDKNITPLNYAVCNNNGQDITFYQADCDTISTINKDWLTSSTSRFYNQSYTEITCKTTTIDNLINQYGVPSLIKIDVEGGEYECISSLTQKARTICFEWASETNDITLKCIDYLNGLGYVRYAIQYCDNYTYRPHEDEFYDSLTIKRRLLATVPKQDWGMIWCKL